MVLGKLDRYMQKNELDHVPIPHTRINSKWIKDLNVTSETIKIKGENIISKILDVASRIFFIRYISPDKEYKRKKWEYIKLKTFCTAKENIYKIKRETTEWENILTNTSDKGLI